MMSKSETKSTTTTWRPDKGLAAWMLGRAERSMSPSGLSARTRTEMILWRAALGAELDRQRWMLDELAVIAQACNGVVMSDALGVSAGLVAVEVSDMITREGSADNDELVGRLMRLGPTADHALADAVCRWWVAGGDHTVAGWAAVGVRVTNSPQPRTHEGRPRTSHRGAGPTCACGLVEEGQTIRRG